MLTIDVILDEDYDERQGRIVPTKTFTLELEHSLASLSKWEAHYEKPFLSDTEMSPEETLFYVKAMTLTRNVPPEIFSELSQKNMDYINAYMVSKQSATTFFDPPGGRPGTREIITAEIIYFWMFSHNIPLEWENRHLGRLLTLIKVCNRKNEQPKKMSPAEAAARQRQLNADRRAQYNTRG